MLPVVAYVVSAVLTIGSAPSPRLPEYSHVRAADKRFAKLIDDTVRRSPTFARLHAALSRTDVILFVEPTRALHPSLHGRLHFITATPLARYLRAEIRMDLPRGELIAAIAHEMQHALEIGLAGEVTDARTLAALYRRIGPSPPSRHYDTDRAYDVAARVKQEGA